MISVAAGSAGETRVSPWTGRVGAVCAARADASRSRAGARNRIGVHVEVGLAPLGPLAHWVCRTGQSGGAPLEERGTHAEFPVDPCTRAFHDPRRRARPPATRLPRPETLDLGVRPCTIRPPLSPTWAAHPMRALPFALPAGFRHRRPGAGADRVAGHGGRPVHLAGREGQSHRDAVGRGGEREDAAEAGIGPALPAVLQGCVRDRGGRGPDPVPRPEVREGVQLLARWRASARHLALDDGGELRHAAAEVDDGPRHRLAGQGGGKELGVEGLQLPAAGGAALSPERCRMAARMR